MTTLIDGPAEGKRLMLKRSPFFLRVVIDQNGKVDALDQPGDSPAVRERVFTYEFVKNNGSVHINAKKGGGLFAMVDYKLCETQPEDVEMRRGEKWIAWCERQAKERNLSFDQTSR